jgi:hypothetical protein
MEFGSIIEGVKPQSWTPFDMGSPGFLSSVSISDLEGNTHISIRLRTRPEKEEE